MAQVSSKCFCSVPLCSNSKQKQPYLSFHSFPAEEELRKKWVIAIRRVRGRIFKILRNSTHVCSAHFEPQDIYVTPKGKTWLKKGAIPRRFSFSRCCLRQGDH
uniref:THAP domain-containing protein 1 n=1 Tax=Astyanax mexicanus TaxID=7994 RepID=A0A3B1J269_ASTMX